MTRVRLRRSTDGRNSDVASDGLETQEGPAMYVTSGVVYMISRLERIFDGVRRCESDLVTS